MDLFLVSSQKGQSSVASTMAPMIQSRRISGSPGFAMAGCMGTTCCATGAALAGGRVRNDCFTPGEKSHALVHEGAMKEPLPPVSRVLGALFGSFSSPLHTINPAKTFKPMQSTTAPPPAVHQNSGFATASCYCRP